MWCGAGPTLASTLCLLCLPGGDRSQLNQGTYTVQGVYDGRKDHHTALLALTPAFCGQTGARHKVSRRRPSPHIWHIHNLAP